MTMMTPGHWSAWTWWKSANGHYSSILAVPAASITVPVSEKATARRLMRVHATVQARRDKSGTG
ncbi:hypothetical protein [Dickeya sp. CSL RW240]|uniref:hypothetical protein n=1 Tax=Dickeya sp. CSL RW240 TaxID=1224144 RepID=UPI00119E1850|nr:hypothetical protein [Dickeya sp. CSL RW240]